MMTFLPFFTVKRQSILFLSDFLSLGLGFMGNIYKRDKLPIILAVPGIFFSGTKS